jgi:hypothetical protein
MVKRVGVSTSAAVLVDRASRLGGEAGRTFSATVNKTGTPIHAFLSEVVASTRSLPKFRHPEWPQLVPYQRELPLHSSTVGTAFGWLLRLVNDADISTYEAARGANILHDLGVNKFAADGLQEVRALAEDLAADKRTPRDGERERVAVVLAWFEERCRPNSWIHAA